MESYTPSYNNYVKLNDANAYNMSFKKMLLSLSYIRMIDTIPISLFF
jgi:hypothetical protein